MCECIIIGGGVIGLLTARELHRNGVDVLLIERGSLGGESSWAGGGIISPLYPWRYQDSVNTLAQKSKMLYPELAVQLMDESGIDCELLISGLLVVDENEVEQALSWSEPWSVDIQHITDQQVLQTIEPAMNSEITQGLWMLDIMQIRNPKIIKALKGSFENLNIAYREHTRVLDIIVQAGHVTGVRTKDKDFRADKVVVAGGAWSTGLIEGVHKLDVEPVKGQMIMFRGEPDCLRRIVLSEGHYVIPRRDGRILAGSTLERTGFDKTTTDNALQNLRDNAVSLIPSLASLEIERQWAGLRPGTANGVPYICPLEEVQGLYVHAGHYRNGIVLGPASVQLMVELVQGKTPFCDPSPYAMTATH
jgi:glycine oxidase